MKRHHGRFPVLRALLGGALAVGACGHAEDPTNVSVTIDPTVSHQTLVGFGAATAYLADLLSGRTDDIFQVLFVDSGLDILRLGNWYQNLSSTDTTPDTPFADSASVQIVQKAAAARGGTPPKILMSAWTPPAYLKSNGVTRPPRDGSGQTYPAGTLSQSGGAYAYAEYADWWVRALQAYAAQGVGGDDAHRDRVYLLDRETSRASATASSPRRPSPGATTSGTIRSSPSSCFTGSLIARA